MNWKDRITVDSRIVVGKPVIKGTRIAVELVIALLAQGWTREQILESYPNLTVEDIRACLAYASETVRSERVYPMNSEKRSDLPSAPLFDYHRAVDYSKIITLEPGKRSGKPCIRGLRITVYDVLGYLAAGMTHEQILNDFPYLTEEDIRACLAYAADGERRIEILSV